MHVAQQRWTPDAALTPQSGFELVLAFGDDALMSDASVFDRIAAAFPGALLAGCSSSGEIEGDVIHDGSIALTVVRFDRTAVRMMQAEREPGESDEALGERLARRLPADCEGLPLAHVLMFADGVHLNGTRFVEGFSVALPEGIAVTGGLAGDSSRFVQTPVWAGGVLQGPAAVAIGFYSRHLRVGWGAVGGWHPFGPDRLVTRAAGNVLYALDDRPALDLYKQYLGPHAKALPGSGLLFPLAIRKGEAGREVVRSTIGIDEDAQSITFAGDVPEGAYARFMKTNNERLTDGATEAAEQAVAGLDGAAAELAILVSCVGRRLVMGPRTEDELEAVAAVLGRHARMTGFYSHGELAPFGGLLQCDLHNQTMTITVLAEVF